MRTKNPFALENPDFHCCAPQQYALEAALAISDPASGDKFNRYSTLTFRTDEMGGYPMRIAIRIDGKKDWFAQNEVNEVCIQFAGDYEADTLVQFFQHVGGMLSVTHGVLSLHTDGDE